MNIIPAIADKLFSALRVSARLFFAPEPRIVFFRPCAVRHLGPCLLGTAGRSGRGPLRFCRHHLLARKGRMFWRMPSLRSGCQPWACSLSGFQRTKMSSGASPSSIASNLPLERPCGSETFGGPRLVGFGVFRLLLDPVAEIAVSKLLQIGVIETVIIDQSVEPISPSVP